MSENNNHLLIQRAKQIEAELLSRLDGTKDKAEREASRLWAVELEWDINHHFSHCRATAILVDYRWGVLITTHPDPGKVSEFFARYSTRDNIVHREDLAQFLATASARSKHRANKAAEATEAPTAAKG